MKKILRLTFISLVILLTGCEVEKETVKQDKIIVRPFSMKSMTAKSNSKLAQAVNSIRKIKANITADSADSKLVFDEKSGLYFDDEKGLYIEKDGLKSYTFPVLKTTADKKLKNICFNEKQNGSFDVYLIKYDLTKTESLTLTEQQKQAREKQFIPLIKDGVPLEELKMQCIDIYMSTTTEYVVPIDNGELTGNFGTTTVSHTTSVLIGSSCTIQGLSGGNQSGGNTTIASEGSGTGSGSNNPSQDGDIITGLNTRDLENVLGDEELFYYNYTAFTSLLNSEQNAAFNAHPELMEYFIANGWSNENQGLVRTLIDKFQGSDYTEQQKETLRQLVSVCAAHHLTFDFNNSTAQNNSYAIDKADDLENYFPANEINSDGLAGVELPSPGNSYVGTYKFNIASFGGVKTMIKVAQSASGGASYRVTEVTSNQYGILFGTWSQDSYNIRYLQNNDVRVDIYGTLIYDLSVDSINIKCGGNYHLTIIIDMESSGVQSSSWSQF